MSVTELVERGRSAFARRAWVDAYEALAAASVDDDPDDVVRLATAAVMLGHDDEGCDLFGRAHQAYLAGGDTDAAARCAFWAAMNLANRRVEAPAGGWLARARRLADGAGPDAALTGYLRIPAGRAALEAGRPDLAAREFDDAARIGQATGEHDLLALGRMGQGQARVLLGDVASGGALIDEAMLAVTSGEVSELTSGVVYCAVVAFCHTLLDVRRAREWTVALTRWCALQPDLVPFAGECLVHRSEVLVGLAEWDDALAEADRAVKRLADPPGQPMLGAAWAQKAEVHRLRGELDAAEDAYRTANRLGQPPGPGLALLRLAQGRPDDAAAVARGLVAEPTRCPPGTLAAAVEVLLAADDVDGAAAASAALDAAADTAATGPLAGRARGAVLLARGDAAAAVDVLRRASARWLQLGVPYEAARTRAVLARALDATGDHAGAELERDGARWTFEQLGARTDLAGLDPAPRSAPGPARAEGGLTARELEVLRLVAAGMTNREIARDLVLSERTVARHLANIFGKLGVPSRTAAAAFAYTHGLA